MKRISTLLLSLLLIAGSAAACSPKETAETTQPPAGDATAAIPSPESTDPFELPDYVTEPEGEVVFTLAGEDIHEKEFKYWARSLLSQEPDPDNPDWDYIKSESETSIRMYHAVAAKAKEQNLSLSEEQTEYIQKNITSPYEQWLMEISIYFQTIISEIEPTDEDIAAAGTEFEVLRAKHILFKTKEADRTTPLSDELIAEALKQATDVYDELLAVADDQAVMLELYDTRMRELSQDGGSVSNPDGYQWVPGTMREAFTTTTQALAEYEFSEPTDIEDGYSVILRLPLDPDMEIIGIGTTLRGYAQSKASQDMALAWAAEIETDYAPEYADLDVSALLS
ncbi:MAG: peptidyl-prolyl cis-trans isomerase [Oscillospiraceae bacterium]|jgi:hypothetical protein|nr:peptidyl-prolyl cis-trans isomerase [Oscillospiraceae bacterium]